MSANRTEASGCRCAACLPFDVSQQNGSKWLPLRRLLAQTTFKKRADRWRKHSLLHRDRLILLTAENAPRETRYGYRREGTAVAAEGIFCLVRLRRRVARCIVEPECVASDRRPCPGAIE